MPKVRLIDANALMHEITESLRFADEWAKESNEKGDRHGAKCAIETQRSLLSMMSRVKEAPTIDAEPVRNGQWEYDDVNDLDYCSECNTGMNGGFPFCPWCGARMDLRTSTEVGLDIADSVMMGG